MDEQPRCRKCNSIMTEDGCVLCNARATRDRREEGLSPQISQLDFSVNQDPPEDDPEEIERRKGYMQRIMLKRLAREDPWYFEEGRR